MREAREKEIGDTERIEETAEIEENAEIAEEEVVIEIHETVETTDIAAAAQAEKGVYTHSDTSQEGSCYVTLDGWYCLKSSQ